jgi:putative transposase
MEDWEYSSFREYMGLEKDTLCSHQLACDLLRLPENRDEFYHLSYGNIDVDKIKNLL